MTGARTHRALAIVLLGLAGCAAQECATLPGGRYCLQPARGERDFAVLQEVLVERAGDTQFFVASVEKDGPVLRFALLTAFGQTLLAGESGPQGVRLAGPWANRIAPALPAAMLELAWWPEAAVRDGLRDGLELVTAPGRRRLVDRDGRDALVIDYSGDGTTHRGFLLNLPALDVRARIGGIEPASGRGTLP